VAATPRAMRRRASVWAVGHAATKESTFRVPRQSRGLKATVAAARVGEQRHTPGGVFDHGTQEEDDPGTWEALLSPRIDSGVTETR